MFDATLASQRHTGRPAAHNTRPATRNLLTRILGLDDRYGIYAELTRAGHTLLDRSRLIHDETLECAFDQATAAPKLAFMVDALNRLQAPPVTA